MGFDKVMLSRAVLIEKCKRTPRIRLVEKWMGSDERQQPHGDNSSRSLHLKESEARSTGEKNEKLKRESKWCHQHKQ